MVRVNATIGIALALGAALGFGAWLMVSCIPILRRPRLMFRVAPYVLDVSPGARDLLARRRVDPGLVAGVVASPVSDRLAPVMRAVLGAPEVLERRLRQARSPLTPAQFRARQLTWALVGAAVAAGGGVVLALRGASGVVPVALALVGAALGAMFADWRVQRAAAARMRRISSELPTVLEFLTLSLAAGEGLADALRRVARVGTGELAGEFAGVVSDSAAGTPLADALQRLASELQHPQVSRAIEQMRGALERGTPLAQTLQAHAADAREAAKRDLLEAAGRKEIAMLVPLVFGLLPTTVAFALWPGIHVLQVGF